MQANSDANKQYEISNKHTDAAMDQKLNENSDQEHNGTQMINQTQVMS